MVLHSTRVDIMSRTRYKFLPRDYFPYFLTATTVNWLPLFKNPDVSQIIIESLTFMINEGRLTLYAYVLMENHLHLVASAKNLSQEIANFKSFTARRSIDYYIENKNAAILEQLAFYKLRHRKDRKYQFWQEGVHPKRIKDNEMMHQKIEYIHINPVRKGYVDEAESWLFSSAQNYAGRVGLLEICTDW
jgi:putative transposase